MKWILFFSKKCKSTKPLQKQWCLLKERLPQGCVFSESQRHLLCMYQLGEQKHGNVEHLSSHTVGSSCSAGSELLVSSCRRTATGISCFYDHTQML